MSRFEKSSNPMMKQFENASYDTSGNVLDSTFTQVEGTQMTLGGTMNKTLFLLAIMIASAVASALYFPSQMTMYIGMGGALVTAIAVGFKPTLAPMLAPVYAILEGMFLGVISLIYAGMIDGIVFKAVGLTVATLVIMLMIYRSGLIPVTQKFRMVVVSATMGIMVMYAVAFVMNMFFGVSPTYLHEGSMLSIGLSLFIIGVASLNFLLDFDMIERGVQTRAPKYMEWYGGFALLTTLAWLYFEFLRLLMLLASND